MRGASHSAESGIDLIEVARVRRLLQENPAAWLGMSTPLERRSWPGATGAACVLAGKEAILKALQGPGADEVNWQEMELLPGPPLRISFHSALAGWVQQHRPGRWLGTVAACGSLAVAWMMWLPDEEARDCGRRRPDSFR